DAPAHDCGNVPSLVVQILEVPIPGKRHEHIGGNQQQRRLHKNGRAHQGAPQRGEKFAGSYFTVVAPEGTSQSAVVLHPLFDLAAFDQANGAAIGSMGDEVGGNAQLGIDGGGDIFCLVFVLDDVAAFAARGAQDAAAGHAGASHDTKARTAPVIAAAGGADLPRPANI